MVVLRFGVKLSMGVQVRGPPMRCMPRLANACILPRATWHELQSSLQMVGTCARLRGALVGASCEPSPVAVSAGPGTT